MTEVIEKKIVIIPTFNESENILSLIENLQEFKIDILIVDDNSPDKTYDIVAKHNNFGKSIFAIKRYENKGYGNSIIDGIKFSLKNNYEIIAQMDSDFSHNPNDLISMIKLCDMNLVIGSRYIPGGKIVGWKIHRILLSRYSNQFARFVLNTHVKDLTSGFRVYSSNILRNIDYLDINSNGYSFLVELLNLIVKRNFEVIEFPITFIDRKKGKSKMNYQIIFESVLKMFKILLFDNPKNRKFF